MGDLRIATGRPIPDRNLALDLVRVTESAAMAAGRWVGRGSKNEADRAAVDALPKGEPPRDPGKIVSLRVAADVDDAASLLP